MFTAAMILLVFAIIFVTAGIFLANMEEEPPAILSFMATIFSSVFGLLFLILYFLGVR